MPAAAPRFIIASAGKSPARRALQLECWASQHPILFAAIAFFVGVGLVCLSLWLRFRSRASLHWPSVTGQVIESRIDDRHPETTQPVLRYRYEVNGKPYVGFRVAFSGHGVSRPAMERLIQPYPAGSIVQVFYDPQNPASAVLNNKARSDWAFWLPFGVGFLLLGVYLVG